MSTASQPRHLSRGKWGIARKAARRRLGLPNQPGRVDTMSMHAVGYRDAERFVAVNLHADAEAAQAEAWGNQTIEQIDGQFPGTMFLVLEIEPPRSFTPAHILDAPERLDGFWTSAYRPEETLPRERAISAVAIRNAHRGPASRCWSIVLEVGRMIDCHTESVLELDAGIGIQRGTLYRPVRLVRPTADDARRLAEAGL
jgi:hypothetical protein